MSKRWNEAKNKPLKNSPLLYEDEEIGTSSPDEVKVQKSSATPKTKLCSGHSTPIRSKNNTDSSDSPDLKYNDSPIEPLTQNPPNEVGWDYQRPVSKEDEEGKSPLSLDISKTPKRNALLTKKRNSNSPLLYKPLKKKLIQDEQKEDMAGLMEDLKAIASKAKQSGDKNVEVSQNTGSEIESQLIFEMDSQPLDESDIKLQVSANTDESPGQNKIVAANKVHGAFLDDSIEDMMVLCSQEVEAKEFGNKIDLPLSVNALPDKSSSPDSSLSKIFKNLTNEMQLQNNKEKFVSTSCSKNSSSSKGDSGSLEIPDDSFDEFFVGIDDKNLAKNVNTEVIIDSVNKTVKTVTKSSTKAMINSTTVQTSVAHNYNHNYKQSQPSNALIQNKIVNTKANYGYLNKDFMKNNSSSGFSSQSSISDKNSESRIFKAKSFSDSNFLHQSSSSNAFGRSTFNLNIGLTTLQRQHKTSVKQNSEPSYYTSNSSTENKSWRRVLSSSSINKTNSCNSSESQKLFSAAEIERKKLEAMKKREEKLKSKNNPTSKRPICSNQNPIKR